MAKECGWDYQWVSSNLTLSQIKRYYETIFEAKKHDFVLSVQGMFYACAAAQGSIKQDKFSEFLSMFEPYRKVDVNRSIEKMKVEGLPVEDK